MLRTNKSRKLQTPQSASLRRAFTLIELLSVVAIIGLLAGVTAPPLFAAITKARVARASGDLRSIAQDLSVIDSLPASLAGIGRNDLVDPWGQPYVYLPFPEGGPLPGAARKDRFSVPINERFDIYSLGPNGTSAPLLTAAASRDDVVAGNDGGFIGLAAKY
ncbi:MAG: prepilin-type N-terminal cleavage/methylation domain-containing protein [Gemmatimonadaceae bacterium]